MIQRRAFVAGMAAVVVAPHIASAQRAGKVRRVGILAEGSAVSDIAGGTPKASTIRALLGRLHELGHRYGENLATDVWSAEGRIDRFPALAAAIVQAQVDVVVVTSNRATMAVKQATSDIPIVMAGATDPVAFALVTTLSRPGGNVTGIALDTGPEIGAKRLELLKEASPSIRSVAYFIPSRAWLDRVGGKAVQEAAAALRVALMPFVVTTREELDNAPTAVRASRPDAMLVEAYIFPWVERRAFCDLSLSQRLPAMFANREIVEAGGLLSYSTDFNAVYRRAAEYVDLILKGTKAGDLPIEQAAKFERAINAKTARALGLTIPPSLLLRADQVIE